MNLPSTSFWPALLVLAILGQGREGDDLERGDRGVLSHRPPVLQCGALQDGAPQNRLPAGEASPPARPRPWGEPARGDSWLAAVMIGELAGLLLCLAALTARVYGLGRRRGQTRRGQTRRAAADGFLAQAAAAEAPEEYCELPF